MPFRWVMIHRKNPSKTVLLAPVTIRPSSDVTVSLPFRIFKFLHFQIRHSALILTFAPLLILKTCTERIIVAN